MVESCLQTVQTVQTVQHLLCGTVVSPLLLWRRQNAIWRSRLQIVPGPLGPLSILVALRRYHPMLFIPFLHRGHKHAAALSLLALLPDCRAILCLGSHVCQRDAGSVGHTSRPERCLIPSLCQSRATIPYNWVPEFPGTGKHCKPSAHVAFTLPLLATPCDRWDNLMHPSAHG